MVPPTPMFRTPMKPLILATLSFTLAACGPDRVTDAGAPGESDRAGPKVASADGPSVLSGLFTYLADAPSFRACDEGRAVAVAMEGAYIDLERAYLAADKSGPGAPLLAFVEGEVLPRPPMEGDGTVPTLVVSRYIGLFPGLNCEDAMTDIALTGTRWRIVVIGSLAIELPDGAREAELLLDAESGRYGASAGCNRINGNFEAGEGEIAFAPGASTRMACPPPLDDYERELISVLANARAWRISGRVLELADAAGRRLATLVAHTDA